MALDRRILSILYYNDIVDVNDVEKFIGEKDGYYIVIVNGETKKLKVPGFKYPDEEVITEYHIEEKIEDTVEILNTVTPEEVEELIKKVNETVELSKNLKEPENEEQQEMLNEIYNEISDFNEFLDKIEKKEEVVEEPIVEEPIVEEPIVEEPIVKEPIKIEKPKKSRKEKVLKTKKIDDDFDDFINLV